MASIDDTEPGLLALGAESCQELSIDPLRLEESYDEIPIMEDDPLSLFNESIDYIEIRIPGPKETTTSGFIDYPEEGDPIYRTSSRKVSFKCVDEIRIYDIWSSPKIKVPPDK